MHIKSFIVLKLST